MNQKIKNTFFDHIFKRSYFLICWQVEFCSFKLSSDDSHNYLLIVLKNIENDFKKQKIEQIIAKFLSEKGLKLSDIIQYIRAMITGLDVSPRIYDIMEVLGFEEIKKRIEYFING